MFSPESQETPTIVEVSHIDGKEFIKCNCDTLIQIPLEETEFNNPYSIKKGQKRMKAYQRQEDLRTIDETMREINKKLKYDYRVAHDAIKRSRSS